MAGKWIPGRVKNGMQSVHTDPQMEEAFTFCRL